MYGTTSLPGLTNLQKVDVSTSTQTRLAALKDAVKVFLGVLQEDAKKNEVEHHIAITVFGGKNDNHSILQGLSSEIGYGDSYYTGLNTIVTNIKSDSGGTPSHKAMEDALEVMSTARDDASHVVVFFTDGSPNGGGLTQNEVARQTINSAYTLKNTYKSTVFSIGLFSSAPNTWKNYYLNNVSSNYNVSLETFPSSQSGLPGSEAPHDKYQYSDGADLSSIFEEIAKETGGATVPLNKETTTVIDVISTDFALPEGAVEDGIRVYAIPALSGAGTEDSPFVFDDADEEKIESDYAYPATVVPSKDKAGNDVISVSNYDFSLDDTWSDDKMKIESYGNWVGVRTWGGKSETKGNKLRIVIPIELKADYSGGYEDFTNETSSGIYAKDKNGNDVMWQFERPYIDFPSIGIIKNGMKKGESATFSVQRILDAKGEEVSDAAFNIILTGTSENGTTPSYTILKDIPEGTYRVSESGWSWTYDVTGVTVDDGETQQGSNDSKVETKVLTKSQTADWPSGISETVKCVLFNFTNKKKDGDDNTIYSEAVVKNKFKGGSVTSPGSTTITSKD